MIRELKAEAKSTINDLISERLGCCGFDEGCGCMSCHHQRRLLALLKKIEELPDDVNAAS